MNTDAGTLSDYSENPSSFFQMHVAARSA